MKKLSESVRLKFTLMFVLVLCRICMASMHFWHVMFGQKVSFSRACPLPLCVTSTYSSSSVLMILLWNRICDEMARFSVFER